VLYFAFQVREDHGDVAAEFPDDLPTGTAGRGERIRISDDGDGIEAALTFGNGLENRNALGAAGEAERCVFDVATGECAFSRACLAAVMRAS
jgi:hypothetical protein